MKLLPALTRQQLLRCLFASSAGCAHLLGTPTLAHALAPLSSKPSATAQSAGDVVLFRADDKSFEFTLPSGWVGVTPASDERSSPSHIIAVTARQLGSGATVRAVVDGGSRGRNYGKSLADLGPLNEVASRLVADELIRDDDAKDAVVLNFEQVDSSSRDEPFYYVVRYLVGFKPAIAKLAIRDGRLYCVKVKSNEVSERPGVFFDEQTGLPREMEEIARSFRVASVNPVCLMQSNAGRVPIGGAC